MATTSTSENMQIESEKVEEKEDKKRGIILVDPDTKAELINAKRPRIQPEDGKKKSVLAYYIIAYRWLLTRFNITDQDASLNINIGIQITNIMFSCHNILRQRAAGTTGTTETKSKTSGFQITSLGKKYPMTLEEALKIMRDAANCVKLQYQKYGIEDKENWYGIAGPYLDFFVGFGLRLTELRLGHGTMPISKSEGKSTSFPVSKYGLYGQHHVLLEGCTFPPEKRSSMAQSLGPMTSLLCFIRSDEKYRDKWARSAKRAMAHIPIIDDVMEVVKGKSASEVKPIITDLADILLMTTSRQSQRMFFPLNVLSRYCTQPKDKTTFEISVRGNELIDGINMSGKGGFKAYKEICEMRPVMEGEFDSNEISQIVFHCIFGTFKEDLGILEQITDCATWFRREQFGKKFQKMTTKGRATPFTMINLKCYARLSTANQTGLLASAYLQTVAVPVFSGRRIMTFGEDFFEQISKREGILAGGKSLQQISTSLKTLLASVVKEVQGRGKALEMGTVNWKSMANVTYKEEGDDLPTLVLHGRNKFFLGSASD